MRCTRLTDEGEMCGEPIDAEDVIVENAAHDEELFDITATCPACGQRYNTFISRPDFVTLEEDTDHG